MNGPTILEMLAVLAEHAETEAERAYYADMRRSIGGLYMAVERLYRARCLLSTAGAAEAVLVTVLDTPPG